MLPLSGKECYRRDRAYVEAAYVILAAQIEALERRRHHATIARQERTLHVEADRIAALLHRLEMLVLNNRAHRPHRPA